ncbi:MAG TPA: zinc-binding dehydrogenase [Limnochordales bacterium]
MGVTSRAAVLQAFHQLPQLARFDVPEPEPGACVVQVLYGGICGTDVHLYHGRLPIPTPVVLGHEGVGRVWRLGEGLRHDLTGQELREGDLVSWASSIPCGRCYWCLVRQERTLCTNRRVYGINQRADVWPHLSGSWADFIYLQPGSAIFRVPDGVTPEQVAALGCAGPTVVHGLLHEMGLEFGSTVLVQGAGPVGMAAAMYARLYGAQRVILVGGPAGRLELARQMGVADVFVDIFEVTDPAERIARVLQATGGRGADAGVECTGVPAAVAEGLEMVRPAGRYLVLGQYTDQGPVQLRPHLITRKQLRLYGSWAFAERHYADYVRSLPALAGRFPLERLVRPYPLEQVGRALQDVEAGQVMKALLVGQGAGGP